MAVVCSRYIYWIRTEPVDGFDSSVNGRVRIDTTDPLAFRSLALYGSVTRGTRMFALPVGPQPSLRIVSVAGQNIPVGVADGVSFELPAGSPATQTMVLRREGFTGDEPALWWRTSRRSIRPGASAGPGEWLHPHMPAAVQGVGQAADKGGGLSFNHPALEREDHFHHV